MSNGHENKLLLQEWTKEELRDDVRYKLARETSGTQIHSRLAEMYGPGVISKQMVRRWFQQFEAAEDPLNKILRGQHFITNEDVEAAVRRTRNFTIGGSSSL